MSGMVNDYRKAFAGFNYNIRLMLAFYVLTSIAAGMQGVLFNLYYLKIGLDEDFLGSLVLVQGLVLGVFGVPLGILADRVKKHSLVKVAFVVTNIVFTLILFCEDPVVLLVLNAIQFMGVALTVAAEFPYVAENVSDESRTHLFSLNMILFSIGPCIGSAVGGYLPRVLGGLLQTDTTGVVAYRLSMLVTAIVYWLGGLFVLRIRETYAAEVSLVGTNTDALHAGVARVVAQDRIESDGNLSGTDSANPGVRGGPSKRVSGFGFSRPAVVLGLALHAGLVAVAASMFMPFMNVIFNQRFSLPTHIIGWIFTIQNILMSIGVLFIPRLGERKGKLYGAVILEAFTIPLYVMLALSENLYLFMAAYVGRVILANTPAPLVDSYTMTQVSPKERARTSATLNLSRQTMWALGGKLGGAFLKHRAYSMPLVLATVFYTIAVAVLFIMTKHPKTRENLAGTRFGKIIDTGMGPIVGE